MKGQEDVAEEVAIVLQFTGLSLTEDPQHCPQGGLLDQGLALLLIFRNASRLSSIMAASRYILTEYARIPFTPFLGPICWVLSVMTAILTGSG